VQKLLTRLLLAAAMLLPVLPATGRDDGVRASCLFRLDYHYGEINPWLFYEKPLAKNVGLSAVFQM